MAHSNDIQAGLKITATADTAGIEETTQALQGTQAAVENLSKEQKIKASVALESAHAEKQAAEEAKKAAEEHAEALKPVEKRVGNILKNWGDLNKLLGEVSKGSAVGLMAAAAIKFQAAFADMQKSVQGTPEQMQALSGEIKELSNNLGVAAADLMKTAGVAASLGVATDELGKFTEQATQMGSVFGVAAEETAAALANIQKAFEFKNTNDLQAFGDSLAVLGETANAAEDEVLKVVEQVSTAANQFGLSAQQTAALSSAFLALGRSPQDATKSIKALLQKLQTAETQSAGFQAALEKIGLSAEQLALDIHNKPQAALTEFLQTLQQLDSTEQAVVLQDLFGDNVGTQIQALVSHLGEYKDAIAAVSQEQQNAGRLSEKYGDSINTVAGEFNQLKNTVTNTLATMGEALLPTIQTLTRGLGSMADAVAFITKTFPNITQMAVLFASAKVAISATSKTLQLLGIDASRTAAEFVAGFTAAKASVAGLKGELDGVRGELSKIETAAANGASMERLLADTNKRAITLTGSLKTLAKIATGVFAAWEVGTKAGNWLYENVALARDLGDYLGKSVAYVDALFTDRTFDDVDKYFRTSKEMAAELAAAEKQAAATAAERERQRTEQLKNSAAEIANLKQQYQAVTDEINNQIASLALLDGKGALYYQIENQIALLTDKQQELNAAIKQQGAAMGELAGKSETVKNALQGLGLSVNELKTGISDTANQAIEDFATAAAALGSNTENMATLFAAALAKVGDSTPALDALKEKLAEVGEKAGLTAQEIEQIADTAPKTADKVAAAFAKLGVDIEAAKQGISRHAKEAFNHWAVASHAAAESGQKDAAVIQAAFEQVFRRLRTVDEFSAFKQQLAETGDAALLSAEQTQRLNATIEYVGQTTDDLGKRTHDFGDKAHHAWQKAARAAVAYQDTVANVGAGVAAVSEKTADHSVSIMAAIDNAMTGVAKAAGASDVAAAKIKMNAYRMSKSTLSDLSFYLERLFKNLNTVTNSHVKATNGAIGATERLNRAIQDGTVNSDMLMRAVVATGDRFGTLDKSVLSNLQQAIENARKKLEELRQTAKSTRAELEKEYASVTGDTEKVAQMEQQAKIKELQDKLNQAKKGGDSVQVAEYSRALKLQKDIGNEKQRQAEQAKIDAEIAEQERRKAEQHAAKMRDEEKRDGVTGEYPIPQGISVGSTEIATPKGLVDDLARAIGESLSAREKTLIEKVLNAFSNQVKDALKRQSR